jgi:hypothetical protein
MAAWSEFEAEAPAIAAAGRALVFAQGTGYAFLGTVRRDGGPRMHPICPVLANGELYAFIVNLGPKYRDLLRDPRIALHAFPSPEGGREFYLTGSARPVADPAVREAVTTASGGQLGHNEFEALFVFDIDHALYTEWANWGTPQTWPSFHKWRAGG